MAIQINTNKTERKNKTNINKRIKIAIEEQDFYLVHQLYKSSISRLLNKKDYLASENMLFDALSCLIQNKKYASCSELFIQLFELYQNKVLKLSPENFEKILMILQDFELNSKEQSHIITNLLYLTYNNQECFQYKKQLHHYLAKLYRKGNFYEEAENNYISTFNSEIIMDEYYDMIVNDGGNLEYFTARAVLLLLANQQYILAQSLFNKIKDNKLNETQTIEIKEDKVQMFEHKILNFINIVLSLVKNTFDQSAKDLFAKARSYYKEAAIGLCLDQLVDKVAQTCFGIVPKDSKPSGGLIENLISSFFSDKVSKNQNLSSASIAVIKDAAPDLD